MAQLGSDAFRRAGDALLRAFRGRGGTDLGAVHKSPAFLLEPKKLISDCLNLIKLVRFETRPKPSCVGLKLLIASAEAPWAQKLSYAPKQWGRRGRAIKTANLQPDEFEANRGNVRTPMQAA